MSEILGSPSHALVITPTSISIYMRALGALFFHCLVVLGTKGGVTLPRNITAVASAFKTPRENHPISDGYINTSNTDQLPALKALQGSFMLLSESRGHRCCT